MKVFGAANHTRESYPESYPRIIPPNHTSSQTFPSGHGLNGNSHIYIYIYIYVQFSPLVLVEFHQVTPVFSPFFDPFPFQNRQAKTAAGLMVQPGFHWCHWPPRVSMISLETEVSNKNVIFLGGRTSICLVLYNTFMLERNFRLFFFGII